MQIQPGDILFQDLDCGPLCDAIESVTYGVNGRDFSHCAMVVKIDGHLQVAEAIGDTVQINSLENFFKRSGDVDSVRNILIARMKTAYSGLIPSASAFAKQQAGMPYDDEYLPANGKWYCSELIAEAFRFANNNKPFFESEPMTFKNPVTGQFDTAWVNYFKKLEKPIPEGVPGINPGLLSRSLYLEIIYSDTYR